MWDPKQTAVVVNPAAGGGAVGRRWSRLGPRLEALLGPVRFLHTTHPDHASVLAAQAVAGGARVMLSLGGDGTHGAVVDGILSQDPPPATVALGLLPAGTGGDLRRVVPSATDLLSAAAALPSLSSEAIDVGVASFQTEAGQPRRRHFINVAALGISGMVDRFVAASSKRLGGTLTFYLATLRALATYTPVTVRLTLDGEDLGTHAVTTVAVCNSRFAGGGMLFAPEARLADGMLDVVVFRHHSALSTVGMSRQIYAGTHVSAPGVTVHRGQRLEATPVGGGPAWLDTDGEVPGVLPARFEVRPAAIRLLGVDTSVC